MYLDEKTVKNRSYLIMLLKDGNDINKIQENLDLFNEKIYLSFNDTMLFIIAHIKNNCVYFNYQPICHHEIVNKNLEDKLIEYLDSLNNKLLYICENVYLDTGLQMYDNSYFFNVYIKWINHI